MTLRPISNDRSVQTVWYNDPAVDRENSVPEEKYVEAAHDNPACWKDMLKFKEGHTPTIFHVGVIAPGQLAEFEDMCGVASLGKTGMHRMTWLCFINSIRKIEGIDGKPEMTRLHADNEYVSPVWLAETFGGPLRRCARFVGSIAYRWNQFGEKEAKN